MKYRYLVRRKHKREEKKNSNWEEGALAPFIWTGNPNSLLHKETLGKGVLGKRKMV